jgi:hypothetical protein
MFRFPSGSLRTDSMHRLLVGSVMSMYQLFHERVDLGFVAHSSSSSSFTHANTSLLASSRGSEGIPEYVFGAST